jgi:hypothetical protein
MYRSWKRQREKERGRERDDRLKREAGNAMQCIGFPMDFEIHLIRV